MNTHVFLGILIGYILITKGNINRKKLHLSFSSFSFPVKPPFLSNTRVWVSIYTSIAILAVDFHIFPRRFAKAETYGTGLMDVGVGGFIMILGFVAREARSTTNCVPSSIREYFMSLLRLFNRRILVFIIFGLIRMASVKATDYHSHVSEYGVHWNFFFTMAAVKVSAVKPLYNR